jgi:hypothetical protein
VLAMFSRRAALSSLLLTQVAHGLRLHPALSTTRLRGGSSSFAMSATAVESAPAAPVEKFRLDYMVPPYVIDTVHLDFNIAEEETLVKARLEIKRGAGAADGAPMVLDGDAEVRAALGGGWLCCLCLGRAFLFLSISMHLSI